MTTKKAVCVLLALCLAATLTGCGKTGGESADVTGDTLSGSAPDTQSIDAENDSDGFFDGATLGGTTVDVTEGKNSDMIVKIKDYILKHNLNIYDIAVMSDDYGIEEYRPQPSNACNDSYSVAKVYTLSAIGMLVDDGLLSVSDYIYPMFSELFPEGYDKAWEKVTVDNVIAHKIGLGGDCLDIDLGAVRSDEYLDLLFSEKLVYEPGTVWAYSDGAYYLLSRIVTKISGQHLDDFLRERLFSYMSVQEAAWSQCSQGYPMGATGLYIRATDLVKLGRCYLDGGVYRRHAYLSAEWVKYVIDNEYEFIKQSDGVYCKYGYNGQALMLCEKSRTVIAWHGCITDGGANDLGDFIATLDAE